jgi:hypothetical protein
MPVSFEQTGTNVITSPPIGVLLGFSLDTASAFLAQTLWAGFREGRQNQQIPQTAGIEFPEEKSKKATTMKEKIN